MDIGRLRFPKTDRKRNRTTFPVFSISDDDRLKHIRIIGKTGLGKSTLIENMIVQDIRAGNGFAVLDPHGSLADKTLLLIPPRRRKDVVLLDLSDTEYPVGFNVLDKVPVADRPGRASAIVDAFKSAAGYAGFPTPQMDTVFYTTTAALLDFPDATLLGIKYILTSKKYRSRVIGHVLDSVLKDIWETDYRKMSDKEQREYAKSAFNKIVQLITDPTIKNVIGQVHSRFDVSDIMDSRKILIIKLPQGKLGIEKTRLIGSFFVSVIHSAALKRSGNAPVFPFYCDEFHNFHGWREMLTGLRKFRVPLILATQFMGQLSPEVAAALEGSVETTVAFRVGVTDAKELSAGFDAKVSDLTTLQPYEAYVSTGPRTHHLRMEPPPERTYPGSPEAIRRRCREDYALPREVVERRIDTFVENT